MITWRIWTGKRKSRRSRESWLISDDDGCNMEKVIGGSALFTVVTYHVRGFILKTTPRRAPWLSSRNTSKSVSPRTYLHHPSAAGDVSDQRLLEDLGSRFCVGSHCMSNSLLSVISPSEERYFEGYLLCCCRKMTFDGQEAHYC